MPQYEINIYTLLYALTAVITLMAAVIAFQHRKVSGGRTLIALLLFTAWWCFWRLMRNLIGDAVCKILLVKNGIFRWC